MKTLFKIFGILFLLFVAFIGVVMYFTSPLTLTTENFFNSIKANDYEKAAQYLSVNFKRTTSIDDVKKAFPYERFKDYSGCSFSNRTANADGTGKLEGKIEFSDGSAIGVKIDLIKENGEWKINHIVLPQSGLTTGNGFDNHLKDASGSHSVNQHSSSRNTGTFSPAGEKVDDETLVHNSMVKLVNAIMSGDYNEFYNSAADQFKNTVTFEETKNAFTPLKNLNINWRDIKDMKPVIKQKQTKEHGIISFSGYYPTAPSHLSFEFEFINEGGKLKLFGAFLKPEQ